jgi:hypothetical protein
MFKSGEYADGLGSQSEKLNESVVGRDGQANVAVSHFADEKVFVGLVFGHGGRDSLDGSV